LALSLLDMKKGTIVDHAHEEREDGVMLTRPIRRRGIIVKVVGNGHDGVEKLYVKFKPDQEAEEVKAKELNRVYPATSRVAQRALRRVLGQHELVGAEFQERVAPVKPRLQDSMELTKKKASALVEPEDDGDEEETYTT